jgi:diguanylate cyclase (GGDEF)-like protein
MRERVLTKAGAWLYPAEPDRARVLDMTTRILPVTLWLGVISAPFEIALALRLGASILAPFILVLVLIVPMGMLPRVKHPVVLLFAGDIVIAAAMASQMALTGGSAAPGLCLMAWPVVAGAGRQSVRGSVIQITFSIAAACLACLFAVNRTLQYGDLRLVGFLTTMAGVAVLVAALARAERQAREQSLIDPLTGVFNRLALNRRIEELEAQAVFGAGSLSVLAGDIDHFKDINDAHGHDVGDVVLREIAEVLRTNLRAYPLLYRTGGEEFAVVLPGLDCLEGERIAERLRKAVEKARPADLAITMSLGVAASGEEDSDISSVFKAADRCLYRAKDTGRNRVVARRGREHKRADAAAARRSTGAMRAA